MTMYAEQNLRLSAALLEKQGEINKLTAELAEANRERDEADRRGWHRGWDEAVQRQTEFDNRICQFIPERYEANYNPIEEWVTDAAQVVVAALHLHKFGMLGPFPGLSAAVEKIYPELATGAVPSSSDTAAHAYTSTACQHDRHTECRLDCKFCAVSCSCACHVSSSDTAADTMRATFADPNGTAPPRHPRASHRSPAMTPEDADTFLAGLNTAIDGGVAAYRRDRALNPDLSDAEFLHQFGNELVAAMHAGSASPEQVAFTSAVALHRLASVPEDFGDSSWGIIRELRQDIQTVHDGLKKDLDEHGDKAPTVETLKAVVFALGMAVRSADGKIRAVGYREAKEDL